MMHPHAAEQ